MPVVLAELPPLSRVRDPLMFTCALAAVTESLRGDRVVVQAAIDRARPYQRTRVKYFSREFFYALAAVRASIASQDPK